MKKKLFLSFALAASVWLNAQQKNTLLNPNFWKNAPDVTAVKAEIAKGNNPSESNDRSFDAVVYAINNDAPNETIKFLLDQPGNSVNKSTHDNRIYLHWAAYKGNAEIVNYLIDKGSDVNLEDSHATTPITFAAGVGQTNTEVYDALFKAGINPKHKYRNRNGANLLHLAIASDKDLKITNYLITKGLSLKDTDNDGNTVLDYAAKSGDLAFLKTLASKGVKFTDNAIIFAAEGSRRDAASLEVYRYLVEEAKLNPKVTNKEGATVLHLVANKPKQTEVINYFISKGVDVNKADNSGTTALMAAATSRDTEALELFISKTKDINTQNIKGESALTMAVKSGSPKSVELLLNTKANSQILDKEGYNLGYYLIQSYRPQMGGRGPENNEGPKVDPFEAKSDLLQKSGLDLAAAQKDGSTLYHFAVVKNDLNLVKKLQPLQIDVNSKNTDGLTALHKAAMVSNDDQLLKYLLSIGAQKETKTEFDETAYALAKENETLTKQNVSVEFLKS
ncbi:ankyrin repeat domain-containing protein [Flavobacterium agrisoli]|uniref:Ankyrin repeat domain-containing protein n=1 Tax=Flavobacterium agrisoli TaxID=2793066 RepID=A0A934PLQ1_9FLAO|nr:ankyrin repeat domain-containing protein [Flavobacterium agrisoli]MBK0369248.1 ankyrin repeat domain-containing protein [Flavobacterium agrisoli]